MKQWSCWTERGWARAVATELPRCQLVRCALGSECGRECRWFLVRRELGCEAKATRAPERTSCAGPESPAREASRPARASWARQRIKETGAEQAVLGEADQAGGLCDRESGRRLRVRECELEQWKQQARWGPEAARL